MTSSVRIPDMEEFNRWPNAKKFTFTTIGNYFKTHSKDEQLSRADVYRHMKTLKDAGKLIFVDTQPYEKMVWKYVDELLQEEYVEETQRLKVGNKEHYRFRITRKGINLHKGVSHALNIAPDEIFDLASKMNPTNFVSTLKNLEGRSYPAPSLKKIKEALEKVKKEVRESEEQK